MEKLVYFYFIGLAIIIFGLMALGALLVVSAILHSLVYLLLAVIVLLIIWRPIVGILFNL